jgi:hypothetical protein
MKGDTRRDEGYNIEKNIQELYWREGESFTRDVMGTKPGVSCEISGSHGGEYEEPPGIHCRVVSLEWTALMMEAVRTSDTWVYNETTWCYIPEGSNLHSHVMSSIVF